MKSFLALAALPLLALAKTDFEGCTSSETVKYGGASMIYWDPTNGEICSFLDCGGGRAPPKTTVPGCAAYSGTATYTPDYMPGWGTAGYTGSSSAEMSYATSSSSSEGVSVSASETKSASGSTLITSAATLPSSSASSTAAGTGGLSVSKSLGGNNVTATATLSPSASAPVETGAANALSLGVAQGVVGLMAGLFGLAIL